MASRQTIGTYAAPGTYSNASANINLSNQSGGPGAVWMTGPGVGASNTAASQVLPILPANATPNTSGITQSGTTVTVTLGSPHGMAIASSGQSVTISTSVGGYNGLYTVTNVPSAYSFTYTASSSGLTSPAGLGTATLVGGSTAALRPWQPALQGTSVSGATCGAIEVWSDGALWDTTNSRFIQPTMSGFDPANLSTARS
jgi:hypothetical protein